MLDGRCAQTNVRWQIRDVSKDRPAKKGFALFQEVI
jgi:hypothetical protein